MRLGEACTYFSQRTLSLFLLLLMVVVGNVKGWADTSRLTAANGWTKVTDFSGMTLSDYYFAFVDDTRDLMLSFGEGYNQTTVAGYKTMVYRTGEKAEMNPNMLWEIDAHTDGGYAIKNVESTLYIQCEQDGSGNAQPHYCRTHDVTGSISGGWSWARWILTYADSKWTIQNGKYTETTQYVGPWEPANFVDGAEVAGNKTDGNIGYFQIYAIKKTNVDWAAKANTINPANYTYKITNPDFEGFGSVGLNGWTNSGTQNFVIKNNNDALGKSGNNYVETYHLNGTMDINQTLSNMPAGKYVLRAKAASGQNGKLYAGESEIPVSSTVNIYEIVTNLASEGDLKIGFSASDNGTVWNAVDNFQLYYYGPDAVTTTWNFSEYSTQVDLNNNTGYSETLKYAAQYTKNNMTLLLVGNSGTESNKEYMKSSSGFHCNGASSESSRYIAFTPPVDGILTVTGKGNGGGALNTRIVAIGTTIASINDVSSLPDGVLAAVNTTDGTKSVSADVQASLTAGTTYYAFFGKGGSSITKLVFSPGYTVTYTTNGFGGAIDTATGVTALPAELPNPTFAGTVAENGNGFAWNNNYPMEFLGWFTDEACTQAAVAGATITANTTLYAKWSGENVCRLGYNLNGGTGDVPALTVHTKNSNVTVAGQGNLSKDGYTFGGWQIDRTGTVYTESSSFVLNGNRTLYALWNPILYHVTYNLNGGTGTLPTQGDVATGAEFTVASGDGITKTGYTFTGWNDGTANVAAGDTYRMGSADVTLTAQWQQNSGSSTVSDLVTITTDYRFTPSAKLTDKTLYEGNKLISLGGSGYSNGLQIKTNRAIAFNVAANAVIKVTARNNGSVARSIQLGTALSAGNYDNIASLLIASGETSTLTHKYTTGGLVYLTSDSELYMTELEIIFSNGYSVTYVHNGHGQHDDYVVPDVFALPTPLPTPTAADGYTFVGWYNDNGTFTSAPSAGENLSANKTLYAKWMITKGNNVKLDANGITTTVSQLVQPQTGMAIALPSAYETAEDIAIPANATDEDMSNWTFAPEVTTNKNLYVFNGVKTDFREAYITSSLGAKDVLIQNVSVANGKYEVVLDVAASATNIRDHKVDPLPTGNTLTKAFAGNTEQFVPVIDRTAFDPETDYDRVVLVTEVTNGTLTYGIKNVAASGNWYVCRVHSIKKIDDTEFTGWNTKADGTGTAYAKGASYTPASNNGTLYAQWNKTYTFRPVASNGTLSSVTVNDSPVSVSNNQTIKVPENATIVMTVAANSGFKFKNWVANGTVGTEDGMTYTISAINANTVLTAKFEAKNGATDPNPANGALSGTTVTINTFPAAYGEKQQSIDLGLPEGATAVVKTADGSLNASISNGVLSIKAPTAPSTETPNSATITITVTAENGSTKDYTVTISTGHGVSYSYSVNAIDGSTVLETLASGDYAEGTGAINLYYPQHILKGTKLYELTADAGEYKYRKSFTPDADNYAVNIEKTAVVNNVVYFTEAEDLPGYSAATGSNTPKYASNGAAARNNEKDCYATTLNRGKYKFVVRGFGSADNKRVIVKVNGETVFTKSFTSSYGVSGEQYVYIKEDNADVTVATGGDQASGLDWFYIQKMPDDVLIITEDEQIQYLTKVEKDAHLYFTSSDGWLSSSTKDGVTGQFMSFGNNTEDYVQLNTYGATAFEVFVDADASKNYYVKVGDNSAQAKNKTIKGLESSGVIATGSNSSEVTIKVYRNQKGTASPVKIKFYTKPLIVGAETSVTMGKGAQQVNLEVVGGTAQMATPSAQTTALVTATFNSSTNQLTLTPVKAGVAHLTFNIVDSESNVLNTVDYVVNVVKQPVVMTYLHNGKDAYNASTDAEFHSPTVLIKDMEGNDITEAVNTATPIIYISDDETLVKYNSGTSTAVLKPNVQGVAKLKAVLYNNNIYENALATYVVSVSSGVDKKLYEVVDGKKDGLAEPAINSTLVAEQGGKVLMTMTYGGYKYQDKLIEEGKGGYTITDSKGEKVVKDSWKGNGGKFSAYKGQGTDIYGQAFDNQIDDFGFQVQAQQDSRDEYKSGIDWYTTRDVKPNGTHYTEYERIKPFSLPVSGAYLKFEAEVNGTLTAYVLQNGNITFSDDEGHRDEPDAVDPLGANPRVYYWFNQDGYRIDPTSFTSKQPLTIGRDWNGELEKQIQEWIDRDDLPELEKYLITQNAWPIQAEVDANLKKPVPTPQTVVRYQEGYMVAQKAYVKYVVPVVAGDTYYFFSNASKVGAAGFNFLPAENGTVELILPEDGGANTMEAHTNDATNALDCANDEATTHKTTATMEMYKTVTLPRKFKVNTWSTICLPFHVTETQVEKVFGKGTNLIIYNGVDGTTARFQKHVNQDILAGQPYLIYPTGVDADGNALDNVSNGYIGGENTLITFHNVNFTPNVAVQSYASDNDGSLGDNGYGSKTPSYKFVGTLERADVNKYDYYINNNTGELTRYTGSGTTLNAYYAYLKNAAENPAQAKVIRGVSFYNMEDDEYSEPTGLLEVLVEMGVEIAPAEGVFNLNGQKIADTTKNLPRGIYVVNGKKLMIK